MKKSLTFLLLSIYFLGTGMAQQTQYMSSKVTYSISYYPQDKTYENVAGPDELFARITIDYGKKEIAVLNDIEGSYIFKGTYKKEVFPDDIKGDWMNEFQFDYKKNEYAVDRIRIFMADAGTFTVTLDYHNSDKTEFQQADLDADLNGVGDISETQTNTVVNDDYSQGGGGYRDLKSIYCLNSTGSTLYVATKMLPNWFGDWVVSDFVKVPPGERVFIGSNVEAYFYFYAHCYQNGSKEPTTWDGSDTYEMIGKEIGQYGFRKKMIAPESVDSKGEWTINITL